MRILKIDFKLLSEWGGIKMDRKEYQKKWREANQEKIKEYQKEWYKSNREYHIQKKKEWAEQNPDKVKTYKKKWYKDNKEKAKENHKKYKQTLPGYLATKLGHCKRRKGVDCEITRDDLMKLWESQDGRCAISNYPMKHISSNLFSVSVDRIDSSQGYTRNNIQLVCQAINLAKNSFSNQEMIEFWEYRDIKDTSGGMVCSLA